MSDSPVDSSKRTWLIASGCVGAVGGALAGNEVEKRYKSTKTYKVSVRMEDGSYHSFDFDAAPPFAVGDRVRVIDGRLQRGQLVVLEAMGGGFTWAAAVLRW